MALITISGYPSSGKSRRALQIKDDFEERIKSPSYSGPINKVMVISDDSLGLSRDGYNAEKPQRSALFTALQRNLTKDTIVILDALNYIKGFRYQMYCVAREASARVFVAATPDVCRSWHQEKPDSERYKEETYEEPSSMVRWDSPLFTVPWNEDHLPVEEIWQAITAGVLKPPNAGTTSAPKPPSSALQALETTTASAISKIYDHDFSKRTAAERRLAGLCPLQGNDYPQYFQKYTVIFCANLVT
ncbi:22_t:CDS:2, partial [Acaulospora colombiana]